MPEMVEETTPWKGKLQKKLGIILTDDNYINRVLDEAKADILSPVTDPAMNTGRPFMMPDGIDIVIDTRDAERKLALIVRKIFYWFGEIKR